MLIEAKTKIFAMQTLKMTNLAERNLANLTLEALLAGVEENMVP